MNYITGAPILRADEIKQNIVALSVTYGRRIALVRLCVASLAKLGVNRLVLVTNGVNAEYKEELELLRAEGSIRIDLIHLVRNVGAGAGFAAAIEHARSAFGETFLWLLDDDNCPREGAISALEFAMRDNDPVNSLIAFTSLRGERFPRWLIAAKTGNGEGVFYRKSSISSLDVRRIPRWVMNKLVRKPAELPALVSVDTSPSAVCINIPGGPYGGFMIHSRHIDVIGLPDPRYVLYFDDLEWTNRVRRNGGRVLLVPGCVVEDAEGDWALDYDPQMDRRFFLIDLVKSRDPKRLYYSIRNNIYFKSRYWSDGNAVMIANVILFAVLSICLGMILRQPRNALTMVRASIDGMAGKLGGSL